MKQKQLIKQCIKGKERALYALYKELFPTLKRITKRYYKNDTDAMSALNSSFLQVVNKLDQFDIDRPIEPWASRITINLICDEFRKKKATEVDTVGYEDHYGVDQQHAVANLVEFDIEADKLLEMMLNLPETTGRVFNLFAVDGYTYREISKMLEITESTCRWHLTEARKRLRTQMENETTSDLKKSLTNELP